MAYTLIEKTVQNLHSKCFFNVNFLLAFDDRICTMIASKSVLNGFFQCFLLNFTVEGEGNGG